MSDYSELKRLAETAQSNWPDSKLFERSECERFIDSARPDVVLALIAENEDLELRRQSLWNACTDWAEKTDWARPFQPRELGKHICDVIKDRFDALKAENEALRSDLEHAKREPLYSTRLAAERYQYLRAQSRMDSRFLVLDYDSANSVDRMDWLCGLNLDQAIDEDRLKARGNG